MAGNVTQHGDMGHKGAIVKINRMFLEHVSHTVDMRLERWAGRCAQPDDSGFFEVSKVVDEPSGYRKCRGRLLRQRVGKLAGLCGGQLPKVCQG